MFSDALEGKLKILNWNVAGAKYLDLESSPNSKSLETREGFRAQLNIALTEKIREFSPHIITLQEVVRYDDNGEENDSEHIIDELRDYNYWPEWLIDTKHYSAPRKWNQVKERGKWSPKAFFAQGNATLVRKDIPCFPIFKLPELNQATDDHIDRIETVKLTAGFYFGDRNTEPRAALITHIVLSEFESKPRPLTVKLNKPLDIFIVNAHLTTIKLEREGIPSVDQEAAQIRMRQLDIITDEIVSRYNRWAKGEYILEGCYNETDGTYDRHKPIWILAGDFNFTPESIEYRSLVSRGFIDLLPDHKIGTKASGLGDNPTLTVDYVFAGPKYEALDPVYVQDGIKANRVALDDDVLVSDHLPLLMSVPIVLPKDENNT